MCQYIVQNEGESMSKSQIIVEALEYVSLYSKCQKASCNRLASYKISVPKKNQSIGSPYKYEFFCSKHKEEAMASKALQASINKTAKSIA